MAENWILHFLLDWFFYHVYSFFWTLTMPFVLSSSLSNTSSYLSLSVFPDPRLYRHWVTSHELDILFLRALISCLWGGKASPHLSLIIKYKCSYDYTVEFFPQPDSVNAVDSSVVRLSFVPVSRFLRSGMYLNMDYYSSLGCVSLSFSFHAWIWIKSFS